jgi:hypothetical protein
MWLPEVGSQYLMAFKDADKQYQTKAGLLSYDYIAH